MEARSGASEGRLNKIEFPRRDAAGEDQQIGFRSLAQRPVESFRLVSARWAAPRAHRRRQPPSRPAWGRLNCGSDRVRARNQSGTSSSPVARIATRDERRPQPRAAAGCRECNLRELDRGSRASSSSPSRACAPWATMFSPFFNLRGGSNRTFPAHCLNMFEHHHRVGAGWNRSAGHNLPGCAFKQGASGASPARVAPPA
jgi:hypothetical protein